MNYKRVLFITMVLALVAHSLIYWSKAPTVKNADSTGTNIIAFGDSLVYGTGSTSGNDLFSLVGKETGVNVINKGVPGETTRDGLARFDSDVLNNDPKVVIILMGGNDYLQKVPQEETFTNLEMMIKKTQDTGAAVVLVGVRGGVFVDKFAAEYERLAKTYRTGYVPNILSQVLFNRSLMYDSIHPNDKGYRIIYNSVALELQKVLEEGDSR